MVEYCALIFIALIDISPREDFFPWLLYLSSAQFFVLFRDVLAMGRLLFRRFVPAFSLVQLG